MNFGDGLSAWVMRNRARAKNGVNGVVGALIGTAVAEWIYAEGAKDEFLGICEKAFDEISKAHAKMKS